MQLIAFIAIFTNTTLERLFFLHASVATMRSMQEEAPRESLGIRTLPAESQVCPTGAGL